MFACFCCRFRNLLNVLPLWHDLWGGEECHYSGLHRCGLCVLPNPRLFPHPGAEGWERDHAKWVNSKTIRLLKIKVTSLFGKLISFKISFFLLSDFRKLWEKNFPHCLIEFFSLEVYVLCCVFPGPFCQDMYQTVVQMTNGPVIWAYLKPLIMGKILYSPDTPATRTLIQKVRRGTKVSPHSWYTKSVCSQCIAYILYTGKYSPRFIFGLVIRWI